MTTALELAAKSASSRKASQSTNFTWSSIVLKCGRIYPELFAASNPNRDANRASTSIGQWNDSPPKPEQRLETCVFFGYNWNGPQSHLGPWLFWAPRNLGPQNLGPEKFGPQDVWVPHEKAVWWFACGEQLFWDPYFSGTKFIGDQKSQDPKWDWGLFQLQPFFSSHIVSSESSWHNNH